MAIYNFELYRNWCDAAVRLGLDLKSQDGGCIYMVDPASDTVIGREGDDKHHFFWILWTPLNKLRLSFDDRKDWRAALDTLKDNHSDFHIEAAKSYCDDESHYAWFPEINGVNSTPTVDDICKCVERIRNHASHDQQQLMATLRS